MSRPRCPCRPLPLPSTVVSASGLTKRFGRLQVLRGVDLAIRAGRDHRDPRTQRRGQVHPHQGAARADPGGRRIAGGARRAGRRRPRVSRADLGYMPQHARFPENLTGREVVRLLRDLRGDAVPEDDELFESFGAGRRAGQAGADALGRHPAEAQRGGRVHVPPGAAGAGRAHGGARSDRERRAQGQDAPGAPGRARRSCSRSHVLSELEELVDDVVFLLEGRVEFEGSLRRLNEATGETRLERAIASLMRRGPR